MKPQRFLDGKVTLRAGDCRKVLAQLPDNCVDAIVTDPPYHLTSIVKRFGSGNAAPAKARQSGAFARASAGFMGQKWDGGDIAFQPATWAAMLRVLKPGGYIVSFASSRGFGRMSVAIEDAGFITHPMIGWIFGSGFPKATRLDAPGFDGQRYGGQVLKPALEPIYMGQKPFSEANGTDNVLLWGTGAVNIDECRVHGPDAVGREYTVARTAPGSVQNATGITKFEDGTTYTGQTQPGRWPANLIHDGSQEVMAAFPDAPGAQGDLEGQGDGRPSKNVYGDFPAARNARTRIEAETSAARFFYCAKASAEDRLGFNHPTIKPLTLKQYLVRLVTPLGGLVLDPFAGTGTTGEAAWREGRRALLVERQTDYLADIATRMELAANPAKRAAVVAAAGAALCGAEGTPLFETHAEAAE